jgi:hypothetical protein
MKTIKQVLRPECVRNIPEQFSWVDQALVQHHLIDRCTSHSAALYLFLITVADCEGLSYYASATLASRLHLSEAELAAARTQLMAIDLIAWQAPLYQVLALPSRRAPASPRPTRPASSERTTPTSTPNIRVRTGPLSLAQLLDLERRHAQL